MSSTSPVHRANPVHRVNGRAADALRPVHLELSALKFAEGSALIEIGDTRVLAAVSVERRVPPFVEPGRGWLTAEYAMLPRATHTRSAREVSRGRPASRSVEIQRLIGRSLRAAVDMAALPDLTLLIDCDVLQADGGTRTAAITAAYAALVQALGRLYLTGDVASWPVIRQVAAISVGIVEDVPLLDLEYCEDQEAAVDMNIVGAAGGHLIEVQGTGEGRSFDRHELDLLVDLGQKGIGELVEVQNRALASVLEEVEAIRDRSRRRPAPARDEKGLWGPPTG